MIPSAQAQNQAPGLKPFGFSNGSTVYTMSDADLGREMDGIRSVGGSWIRLEISWQKVEPVQGQRNWAPIDRLVNAAAARGLAILGLPTYAPAWATNPQANAYTLGSPRNPDEFGNFAAAAATRYGNRISTWEIWNEPNLAYFHNPSPTGKSYLPTLKAAYTAIKAVQPQSTVIAAGLANSADWAFGSSPLAFARALYSNGGKPFFDGLALHPYPAGVTPPAGVYWAQISQLYALMNSKGDGGKKIWITEFGVPTQTNGATEAKQSEIVLAALREAGKLPYVAGVFIHTFRNTGTNAGDAESNFGLLKRDFTPKQAFNDIRAAAGMAVG
ncbi:cellulase family glycosylhydrolase [Rhodococcus sp. IEGM 1401]|uniref:cellulase family glycosylhydrolase n=1 Tax=unclassified Rhodococcus (in: high G+C Gram-positive bacteria) TaxID=192944 RepID=UPI0022B2C3DD|nr:MULTISPECIES: cellulase family glycosylhydrolase [unclassified Rhodococcus (in: high G+C Gram-positive bacteria)]MCZ4560889.1 cellulase family glycosylhydrolase [Rhodococcus sp. IEGM 1401]MDI9921030.1 cellulase family glycosylhydrolase [Rhodococcus sp. IEGM 1372]MDV8033370.1 cellulase family glycosylhydrolase [Rhodococcus sp. IEGM 1414]